MLLQDLETAAIDGGKEVTYFCPNNVAVLLSVSSKALGKAKELYRKFFWRAGYGVSDRKD